MPVHGFVFQAFLACLEPAQSQRKYQQSQAEEILLENSLLVVVVGRGACLFQFSRELE